MQTLYDLLGALPDDDADSLRAAFRKAAKANHPDFNPDNPEASQRFRRIIRANAILSDPQQRETYDRLLKIARRQHGQKSKRGFFSRAIPRLAVDAIASAIVSAMLIGGYLVYMSIDRPHAPAQVTEVLARERMQAGSTLPREIADAYGQAEQHAKLEGVEADTKFDVTLPVVIEPAKPDASPPAMTTGAALANAPASQPRDFGTRDAKFYRDRGVQAYHNGDFYFALVNFDLSIHLDPSSSDSYIDRGIVYHRLGDLKRAFSDVAEAKRIDDRNRSKPLPGTPAP